MLHPTTIKPAVEKGSAVGILNTLNPTAPGTLITERASRPEEAARAIAFKKGISVILIAQPRMLMAYGFVARVFEVFDRHRTSVDLIATSEVSISVTLEDATRLGEALADLEAAGRVEVKRRLAVVAVVGEGAPQRIGLAGHVFTLLGGVGVGVEMISQGASRVNLSFVVREEDADRSVRLLHRGLGLDAEVAEAGAASGAAG